MRIIDMHAHTEVCEPLNWHDTAGKLIALMDEAGIEKAVVSGYMNLPGPDMGCMDKILEDADAFGDRLMPFVRMDPWFGAETVAQLEKYAKAGKVYGVKMHPAHYTLHPYGKLTVMLAEKAGALGLPMLFHCGDEMMCLPLQIGELVAQCPKTDFILAHMGGFAHLRDAITVARRYANVYIDTSEIPLVRPIREIIDAIGPERLLFGTDAPFCDPLVELEKVKLAGLSPREFELVCCQNGLRLLRME